MSSERIDLIKVMEEEAKASHQMAKLRMQAQTLEMRMFSLMLTQQTYRLKNLDQEIKRDNWVRIKLSASPCLPLAHNMPQIIIFLILTLKQPQARRISKQSWYQLLHQQFRLLWIRPLLCQTRIIRQQTQLHFWTRQIYRFLNSRYWLIKKHQTCWWKDFLPWKSDQNYIFIQN